MGAQQIDHAFGIAPSGMTATDRQVIEVHCPAPHGCEFQQGHIRLAVEQRFHGFDGDVNVEIAYPCGNQARLRIAVGFFPLCQQLIHEPARVVMHLRLRKIAFKRFGFARLMVGYDQLRHGAYAAEKRGSVGGPGRSFKRREIKTHDFTIGFRCKHAVIHVVVFP